MRAAKYRVTNHGRLAYETKDPAVLPRYRAILWLIDFHGDRHLDTWIDSFPEHRIAECLPELEKLGLAQAVEAVPPSGPAARILTLRPGEVRGAQASLEEHRAYINAERVKARKAKPAAETVVVVVEDDARQRAIAGMTVEMAGYGVRLLESQAALVRSLASELTPDALLLDVMLPDGDGFDILARLRRLRSLASLPIIMLTSQNTTVDIERGLMLGADGYVTKPYSTSVLAAALGRVLGAAA